MTRETKIGLLVGLAFIIVIGILLSDHLTSSTEPPPAQLTQAGPNVRGGVAIPGAQSASTAVIVPPTNIAPQSPVPTPGDLAPKPPVQRIAIGPAAQQPTAPSAQPQQEIASATPAPIPTEIRRADLAAVAHQYGEQIVPVDSRSRPADTANAAPTRLVPQNDSHQGRSYTAVAGDTLSRIAGRLPGGNTKANRAAIIALNPDLKANPNLIVAGRTYALPSASGSSYPAVSHVASAAAPAAAPGRWYTVKQGDSLWRIANDEVGSPSAVAAIRHLNKEVLGGSDVVRIGMKLKLPARNEVASSN